jgi:hypothetical protein
MYFIGAKDLHFAFGVARGEGKRRFFAPSLLLFIRAKDLHCTRKSKHP